MKLLYVCIHGASTEEGDVITCGDCVRVLDLAHARGKDTLALQASLCASVICARCEQAHKTHPKCDHEDCGELLHVGDWPYCPHGPTRPYHPFVPYFDEGLGEQVNSLSDRWRFMREKKLDYRGRVGMPHCEV